MAGDIVGIAVHPAIGIARVGNSATEFFHGPELPDERPAAPGFHRDAQGAIKRQGARFRLYGYDADGRVVREVTADSHARITWRVHLANKKAAWYQFHLALDIPDARALPADRLTLRNKAEADRASLVIDPGSRTLSGSSAGTAAFDTGKIKGVTVRLGEMRTDALGRLTVLGGTGRSGSWNQSPLTGFANNDGWYDDTADGPVSATVTLDGRQIPVDPAWVVVAPPNYAPGLKSIRTLYDLLQDVFISKGRLPRPEKVSFTAHIEPVLRRFCELQWVNRGFAVQFGWGAPHHFLDPRRRARLAAPDDRNRETRRQFYLALRHYPRDGASPAPWPWIYGDAMASRPRSQLQHLALTATQDALLQRWVAGDFVPGNSADGPATLADAPLAEQPALLDRAALDHCLADAFHPGCEVTWPLRHDTLYTAPFRVRQRASGQAEPSYGAQLTPDVALSARGPLHAQGPGDLTRWMAVPWQADTASCRYGYESLAGLGPRYDPYLPTFWPARVPNQVLTEEAFRTVNTPPSSETVDRDAVFERRAVWLRGLTGATNLQQMTQMVKDWPKLGIVEARDYTVGDGRFPTRMHVESTPLAPLDAEPYDRNLINLHVPEAGLPTLGADAADTALSRAVRAAVERWGYDESEVTVGYIDKIDPFHEGW
ncbi:LodA/GoxA family CTQ-dependent oxidase [Streptomyces cucumeris]|uniref:LodA/GoxA family CTQ-dependent oxidase n=1 Tax=Streptomyces cucumeris TaxID=2962890 RepID=UPI003EB73BA5